MTQQNTTQPENHNDNNDLNTQEECEYHLHENSRQESEGPVSSAAALDAALEYWRLILKDEKASDTAKMNAANGLARFGSADMAGHGGAIHQMTRAELQAEIAKTRKSLGLV